MSERLWIGDGRADFTPDNLSDYPSIEAAILAFVGKHYGQHLKISGPPERLAEVYAAWERLADDPPGGGWIPGPDEASWFVRDLDGGPVSEWTPPG